MLNPLSSIRLLLFLMLCNSACSGQTETPDQTREIENEDQQFSVPFLEELQYDPQIGKFVVTAFEDSKGHLWFGTIENGAARYDGHSLSYFTEQEGLARNIVVDFEEDKKGNLWIATHGGLSSYNGKNFTNYSTKDGLCHNRVSELLFDQQGNLWIGTWAGVCRYDGISFETIPIPKPAIKLLSYQSTMDWVTSILEDQEGNIWIGRDGYGVCKFDGNSFRHFTKEDGLPSNNVQAIMQDKDGTIWFGCRVAEKDNPDPNGRIGAGGLATYDGQSFQQYTEIEGLSNNDIYSIYQDQSGAIWVGANGVGVYRFDGTDFKLFHKTNRADLMPYGFGVQAILEDRSGKLWFGLSGGLFRLRGDTIFNVTKTGPWE